MSEEPSGTAIDELSFDEALEQLETLANRLEAGDIPLEDALEVYERAVELFRHCRQRLTGVEERIEILTRDLEAGPSVTDDEEAEADG